MTIRHIPSPQFGSNRQARLQGNQTADALNQQVGAIATNTGDLGTLQTQVTALQTTVNGNINFPTPGSTAQINGQMIPGTSASSSNTEFPVAHTLGRIPQGYIVFYKTIAGDFYQGPTTGTAWTTSDIFLKCSSASVGYLLFLT